MRGYCNDSCSEPFPDPFLNAANCFLKAANVSSVDIFRISLVLTKKNRNLKVLEKSRALAGTWEYD